MSSQSTVQVLMGKGKSKAAAYIHADCVGGSPTHLGALLDVLLNPSKPIDDWETINWCKWLMAGGKTPDEFASIVRGYDNHAKCGLVWIPHVVAYRCRTCGISPCMSICRECFKRGDHSTHDFNMFLSQAGGACDCGDTSVMKEDGFCSNHGLNNCANKSPAPAHLMCVAEAMMPRIILRLLQHFRENRYSDSYRIAIQECEAYVAMLMEFNNMGELMRRVMTRALINPQMYRNLMSPPFPESEYGSYMADSKTKYEEALEAFPSPDPPDEYKHLPALGQSIVHTTLLEEFIFWTFKFEFPQNIVCFLLNMLPDQDYKEHLTRTFVMHYSRIPLVLERSRDPDTLSNRVVHMSVQLFSNESLALKMVQELSLLHVMIISLKLMMSNILIQNTLHDPEKNYHYVIDCAKRVMKEHCYWPLVSDFNNVLSHKSVALVFLRDDALVDMWFQFLCMLQGMNVNVRELGSHVEFEPSSYYAAFSCELEASAYPMWSVISHLTDGTHVKLAKKIILVCQNYLREWLDAVYFTKGKMDKSDTMHASFHFPLHRYLAAFISQAVRVMGVPLVEVLPDQEMLALLMMHPLRVQSLFYEILSGIWVRNGLQIKGQAMTYIQANFCNSMVDMDLFFLQICATQLPSHSVLNTTIEMFGIKEWLGMGLLTPAKELEQDSMLEGFLTYLATLISSRTNTGKGNDELIQSQLEISALLATSDKTHSQLLELMPERSGNAHTRNFETVLKELSSYRPPPKGSENLEQGLFVPVAEVWERHYDPLHVLLRAVHRRDFQSSMDRFTAYVKQEYKLPPQSTLWPPFRPPQCATGSESEASGSAPALNPKRLLHSRVLHSALLAVLYRAVHTTSVSEQVLALAVFLLEMAVDSVDPDAYKSPICQYTTSTSSQQSRDYEMLDCFQNDSLSENLRTVVLRVALAPPEPQVSPANYTAYEDDGWENVEPPHVIANAPLRLIQGDVNLGDSVTTSALVLPQRRELALPQDLSMVPEQSLVAEDNDDIEMTPEPLALALPDPNPGAEQEEEMHLALPNMVTMGMEVALRETGEPTPSHSGAPALLSGSEMFPSGSPVFLPFARVQPVAVPSRNSDIIPQTVGSRKPYKRIPVEGNISDVGTVAINESIISLLLKLHSQLSGTLDSFSLEESSPGFSAADMEQEASTSSCNFGNSDKQSSHGCDNISSNKSQDYEKRIGDGPYFIGNLLRKIAALDILCKQNISDIRKRLWPNQREKQAEQRAKEKREKEERSRKAKERQQRLMQEFANKQKQFMEKAMESGDGVADMDWREEEEQPQEKEYDCIICNTTSPSAEENPIGLVVLVQSSSVVGHRRRHADRLPLAVSDEDNKKQRDSTQAAEFDRRIVDMLWLFDTPSWLLSVNLGWEGGVHVQSCGHHLHLACLTSYLKSLNNSQRPQTLHIDRGEFLCPVCRQLANLVLPLSPQLGRLNPVVKSSTKQDMELATDLVHMLKEIEKPITTTPLAEAVFKAMEEMTNSTQFKFKQKSSAPSHQSLFLFVTSIARINIEAEIVQRGGSLCVNNLVRYKPKRDCIVPLLHVLSVHARVLAEWPTWRTWSALCGLSWDSDTPLLPAASTAQESPVPLLLRDPCALLFKFVLLVPLHLDLSYFTCIVKVLYNLLYFQVLSQLSCSLSEAERVWVIANFRQQTEYELRNSLGIVLNSLHYTSLYDIETIQASTSQSMTQVNLHALEQKVQRLCLPFLRVAALLRHHLYRESLPEINAPELEFVRLVYYLELTKRGMEWDRFNAAQALSWPMNLSSERSPPALWFQELMPLIMRARIHARALIVNMHVDWHQPRLLRLPHEYERLFTYYHERPCNQCNSVPKESSICMMCGTVVCLKQPCCRYQEVCEAVQHSIDCGGGTGIFLVVTSTYIIIIRGRRACLWGSLYLDDYDEEDRDLKRGKPLYLSEDRFNLLESQWLSHRFDHTKRTWVWHRDSL